MRLRGGLAISARTGWTSAEASPVDHLLDHPGGDRLRPAHGRQQDAHQPSLLIEERTAPEARVDRRLLPRVKSSPLTRDTITPVTSIALSAAPIAINGSPSITPSGPIEIALMNIREAE